MTRHASLPWFLSSRAYLLTNLSLLLSIVILPSAHAQQVLTTVVTGLQPGQIAVNTKTNKIYVNSPSSAIYPGGNNSVTVIDGVTNQPSTIGGLANPTFIDV